MIKFIAILLSLFSAITSLHKIRISVSKSNFLFVKWANFSPAIHSKTGDKPFPGPLSKWYIFADYLGKLKSAELGFFFHYAIESEGRTEKRFGLASIEPGATEEAIVFTSDANIEDFCTDPESAELTLSAINLKDNQFSAVVNITCHKTQNDSEESVKNKFLKDITEKYLSEDKEENKRDDVRQEENKAESNSQKIKPVVNQASQSTAPENQSKKEESQRKNTPNKTIENLVLNQTPDEIIVGGIPHKETQSMTLEQLEELMQSLRELSDELDLNIKREEKQIELASDSNKILISEEEKQRLEENLKSMKIQRDDLSKKINEVYSQQKKTIKNRFSKKKPESGKISENELGNNSPGKSSGHLLGQNKSKDQKDKQLIAQNAILDPKEINKDLEKTKNII